VVDAGIAPRPVRIPGERKIPKAGPPLMPQLQIESPRLSQAGLAWNTPPNMKMSDTKPVELLVTLDKDRMQGLLQRIRSPGVSVQESADLARVVIATLDATNFEVSPAGPQRRQLLPNRDEKWLWTIKPKAAGAHPLILRVESELPDANVGSPFIRTIVVTATDTPMANQVTEFVMKNWDKLLTVVLIPLAGGLWAWRKRRASRPTNEPSNEENQELTG